MAISFSSASRGHARARGLGVTAVLGPTNTGKTHLAIERMLAHSSGMIGLPLRLLAREVYGKVIERIGADSVALITGEEKIKPPNPRFWISTVEAMPRDIDPAFLAIDEVQLAQDFERGHVFTDRMLNRRGREETLLLGAATMRPIVEKLLPGAHVVTRPRLSMLTHSGDRKLTRLPRRSAIVAFSADEVYAIGELIRRQRGGVAIVLGALSPRTRNAQVALYQSGDVDYLVATDAIGMGLNLDVDHVAFASDRKFDGYQYRGLNPAELAQIAGRAGRATRDGTFGTTGRCQPFDEDLIQRLEGHSFEPVKILQWRNSVLDFSSIGALQASLAIVPEEEGLTRAPVAEDILVFEHAARDDAIRSLAQTRSDVERLWEACQVPDYRKIAPANHAELVTTLYGFLMREGKIPADWFARQVEQADRTEGDIDTLSTRIAHVRTWTFVANRPDWLADPEHWQGVTRAVEDKLSDALHERLTARFVDRRTSVLMRRLRENTTLESEISKTGEVTVEGHVVGRLEGFRFVADSSANTTEGKALAAAAQKVLAGEIETRAQKLSQASDDQFALASEGTLRWTGDAVAKLTSGDDIMRPRVRILSDEQLTGAARESVQARLDLWLKGYVEKQLGALVALGAAEDVTGIARGIAFQLIESLGVLERHKVADDVKGLDQPARATLRKYGVRFGAYHIYIPQLLKPAPRALATQLFALKQDNPELPGLEDIQQLASSGRTSIPVNKDILKPLYRAAGYRVCGERAVRVDILERLADLIRPALSWRENAPGVKPAGALDGTGFTVTVAMTSLVGSSGEDFASILRALGYRMERRPKPPEPVIDATASADLAVGDPAAESAGEMQTAAAEPVADELLGQTMDREPVPAQLAVVDSHSLLPDIYFGPTPVPTPVADAPSVAAEDPAVAAEEPAASETSAAISADPVSESSSDEVPAQSTPVSAEPDMIEVWRPGRFEARERPRNARGPRHQGRRGGDRTAAAPVAGDANVAPAEAQTPAGEGNAPTEEQRRPHRHQRPHRGQRPEGQRPQHHGKRGRNDDKRERNDRFERPERRERAERQPDPNSPFAKLAALKAQLESGGKEKT
jgi:ATP-dependent RNA helicase SUPV3L1/SUV3